MARDPIAEKVRRLVTAHPDAPAKTLARRLQKECNSGITLNAAYCRIRQAFGTMGSKHRKQPSVVAKREARRPGQGRPMPKSLAEPWVPYTLVTGGARVGVLSDIHVPYHDEIAVRAAVDHIQDEGFDAILLNGDTVDFYAISRWEKDPSKRDFKGELNICRDFLAWLREQFPKVPFVYKLGNHCERWKHWLWQHAPEISDEPMMSLSSWLHLDKLDIAMVDDQRPVMLGRLPVLHGHELPKGLAAPVNVARGAFLRTLSSVMVGHSHRTSGHAESDMWHKETFCWSTGCLCDMTPEFSRINRWNHGAAVVTVHDDGEYDVNNFRIAKGKVRSS